MFLLSSWKWGVTQVYEVKQKEWQGHPFLFVEPIVKLMYTGLIVRVIVNRMYILIN